MPIAIIRPHLKPGVCDVTLRPILPSSAAESRTRRRRPTMPVDDQERLVRERWRRNLRFRRHGMHSLRMTDKVRRWIALIELWRRRSRERRELLAMSDRELWDMRLTRYDALREGCKAFWRA